MTDYKLVPVEPTPEMLAAGEYALGAGCYASGIYADMLDAAPDHIADARKMVADAVQVEPVGWQFYQDGKWWFGDDRIKNHRKNTEEAGYPVRDVYAAQQPAEQGESVGYVRPHHLEMLRSGKVCGITMEDRPDERNGVTVPLYAAQQPAPDVKALVEALETVKTVLESNDPAIAYTVWVPGVPGAPETLLDHVCAALAAYRAKQGGEQ